MTSAALRSRERITEAALAYQYRMTTETRAKGKMGG
jgi:hypothetical protein